MAICGPARPSVSNGRGQPSDWGDFWAKSVELLVFAVQPVTFSHPPGFL